MKCLRLTWLALVAGLLLGTMPSPAPAQKKGQPKAKEAPKIPDNVELLRDVEFGTGGGRPLKMHILRPKSPPAQPMPVLVWIHGGAWQSGSRDGGIGKLAPYAARGYFCASVEYRLSGEAVFPAQIEDCKCALRYLRAKADGYKIDPNRIGVWGSSAGGHLVALLGTSAYVKELEGKGGCAQLSSRVHAGCHLGGPTDLIENVGNSQKAAQGAVGKLLGGAPLEKEALAKLASPITHITKDAPPFLIVHGDMDK